MRIRSIRPEFWASEDIASLSWDERLLFVGLWSYVDDNGVGRDIEKLIQADLFPLEDGDPRETLRRLSGALRTLSDRSLITRYRVDGKPYLHVTTWDRHQRVEKAAKQRYPLPTCDDAEPRETVGTPSGDPPETLRTGEGEKGRRGEGEKGPSDAAAPTRPEVESLCQRLHDRIVDNGSKARVTNAWRDSCRLMLDRDERNPDQAAKLIDWCQADDFWRVNILSMTKFREQYDKLRLASERDNVRELPRPQASREQLMPWER